MIVDHRMADVTAKICIRCGQDCSGRPRVKDAQGRYCCRECAGSPAKKSAQPAPVADEGAKIVNLAAEDAIPIADDLIPVEETESYKKTRAPCSRCGGAMMLGVPACPACGFDPSLMPDEVTARKKPKKPKGMPKNCTSCKYDLAGVPVSTNGQLICPECGEVNRVSLGRIDLQDVSREVARNAFIKPLMFMGGGLAVSFLVLALQQQWLGMIGFAVAYVMSVLLGFAVYTACSAIWLGFNYTLSITGTSIAAVHAVVFAIHTVLDPTPVPNWAVYGAGGICYAFLLADLMDIDVSDAWIVAVVEWIVLGFIGLAILWIATR
jgi:predicted RNA-binding Zn-ribbon protein involved in translation (DUF1610 family)